MKNIHVVFDLDGTLADTQKIHQQIESDFLSSKGVDISPDSIGKTYAGRSPIEWIPEKLSELGIGFDHVDIESFIIAKDKTVIDLLKKGEISLMPGVEEALGILHGRGYKLGISSGACREFIDAFIKHFNLIMIQASTSADEVMHKKPAPDVFLATFEKLEHLYGSPSEKWVVGDGKSDIIGGNLAGAKTILCYNTFDTPYLYQISDFHEISEIISDRLPDVGSHWRHYKSTGGDDHTYEVIGIAVHSETEEKMVIYRPLYVVTPESWAYGYDYVTRPLSLWYDIVEHKGEKVQRFTEILES